MRVLLWSMRRRRQPPPTSRSRRGDASTIRRRRRRDAPRTAPHCSCRSPVLRGQVGDGDGLCLHFTVVYPPPPRAEPLAYFNRYYDTTQRNKSISTIAEVTEDNSRLSAAVMPGRGAYCPDTDITSIDRVKCDAAHNEFLQTSASTSHHVSGNNRAQIDEAQQPAVADADDTSSMWPKASVASPASRD